MASISLNTFRMGQKAPLRFRSNGGAVSGTRYQDYEYRDNSKNCRTRKWEITHDLQSGKWTVVKRWTQALQGEPHYIRVPKKIESALLALVHRDFIGS